MNVRFVPTKVHGVVDYVAGPALAVAPEVLRLNGSRASALAPRVAGAGTTAYSALTDYELGARKLIPLRAHLALDALAGAALAATPWLAGTARKGKRHWLPHALVGASEIALAATTRTRRQGRLERARSRVADAVPARLAVPLVAAVPVAAVAATALLAARRIRRGRVESELDSAADAAGSPTSG